MNSAALVGPVSQVLVVRARLDMEAARRECARAFRSVGLFFAALQVERREIKAPRATGEKFLAAEPENMGDPRVGPCLMALRWLLAIETARAAKSRGHIAKARARAERLAA